MWTIDKNTYDKKPLNEPIAETQCPEMDPQERCLRLVGNARTIGISLNTKGEIIHTWVWDSPLDSTVITSIHGLGVYLFERDVIEDVWRLI